MSKFIIAAVTTMFVLAVFGAVFAFLSTAISTGTAAIIAGGGVIFMGFLLLCSQAPLQVAEADRMGKI